MNGVFLSAAFFLRASQRACGHWVNMHLTWLPIDFISAAGCAFDPISLVQFILPHLTQKGRFLGSGSGGSVARLGVGLRLLTQSRHVRAGFPRDFPPAERFPSDPPLVGPFGKHKEVKAGSKWLACCANKSRSLSLYSRTRKPPAPAFAHLAKLAKGALTCWFG